MSHFGLGGRRRRRGAGDHYVVKAAADATPLGRATLDASANAAVGEAERGARPIGVAGTPVGLWEISFRTVEAEGIVRTGGADADEWAGQKSLKQ